MLRLIPILLLPPGAMAEGAVDRYACEIVGCYGADCMDAGDIMTFTMTPGRIEADGTGSLTLTFETAEYLARLITPSGPLVWTEGDGTVAFLLLPPDRTVMTFLRHSAGADAPDTTTTHYLSCEVT